MPSPYATTRCALFSPEPTQITLGFFGSIVMAPVENDPSPSKIGVNDRPALTDFHTPPAAVATYQIFLLVGSTATSEMRPDVSAGPIDRNRMLPTSDANFVVSAAGAVVVVGAEERGVDCAKAGIATKAAANAKIWRFRMRRIY